MTTFSLLTPRKLSATNFLSTLFFPGFISITVDVTRTNCDNAYAYINDLATGGLVVFSLKERDSWRFAHPSFNYDPNSVFNLGGKYQRCFSASFFLKLCEIRL